MSGEKLNHKNKESLPSIEASKEHHEKLKNKMEKEASKEASSAEKNDHKELHETRKTVESEAISGKEIQSKNNEKQKEPQNITKAEKTRTYKSTMGRVQNQLSTPSKTFSKIIHNPAVEKTSETLSTTVARPSGILGAGVVGFIVFSVVLYFANRNGFEIPSNSALFVIILIGGWTTGILIEFLYKSLKKISNR